MASSLDERVERLERRLGLIEPATGSVPEVSEEDKDRLELGRWLQGRRRPGETISAVVVLLPDGDHWAETITAWGNDESVSWDAEVRRRTAAICEALASEVRLAILNDLLAGPKATGQLIEAIGIDRGQLYHHLRDLFVHGLVEQPERGRYAATLRGQMLFLAAGHLALIGPKTVREASELDLGDDS